VYTLINKSNVLLNNKIKTIRWLFYISSLPIIFLFVFPAVVFHSRIIIYLEILAALTVGVLFALFFLGVNIYGLFEDKYRKPLYIVMIVLMSAWVLWAVISWKYIEYMDYLLR
jgi:hypothetical protein